MFGNKQPDFKPFFAIMLIILTGFLIEHSEWFNSQRVSAISTVVIALLTLFLAYDARKTRAAMHELAIRPNLIFYQSQTPNDNGSYNFHLENTGVGPAMNIKIIASEPTEEGPYTTNKLDFSAVSSHKVRLREMIDKSTIFNRAILSLGSNQEIVRTVKVPGCAWYYTMKVTISFENIEGKKDFTICHLDLFPELPNC